MSDFRTKLLGLAALATTFAGSSFAQVSCPTAPAAVNSGYLMRAEGLTEQVSAATITCNTGTSTLTTGTTVSVSLSLPVTSKALAFPGSSANSEATLLVTDTTPVPNVTVAYNGTVTGQLVTFSNVTFPANFTATVADIRVNANLAGAVNSVVPVTETILIGQSGTAQYSPAAIQVGVVLRGLNQPTLVPLSLVPAQYTVCVGAVISGTTAPVASYQLSVGEGFPGAFKLLSDPTNAANQENGSYIGPQTQGVASTATQISVTFGNVPATATLYVPTSITYTPTGGTPTTISLASSQVPATTPGGLTAIPAANGVYTNGPVAALPAAVGGTITAVYTVTAANANQIAIFNIPVYIGLPAATAAAPLPAQAAMTVNASFAPIGTVTGPAASTPLFAAPTTTPLNVQAIVLCQTTLMFPFVTNVPGFETGVSIANTTTDNLRANGTSVAAPANGACRLNFYNGIGDQPKQFTTDVLGVSTAASPTKGSVFANTLTAMGPTNFTGYAIAQCDFNQAHGFAFIVNNFGTPSGIAQGYLAVVIPNTRGEGSTGIAPFTAQ
jgi:hypothetical protein